MRLGGEEMSYLRGLWGGDGWLRMEVGVEQN